MPDPTTVLLVRHGETDWIGRVVAGRLPDVHLNDAGRAQADRLAARLRSLPIRAIYSSPLDRTRETAAPLAAALGLEVRLCDDAIELGFGEWTSRRFADLSDEAAWQRFNTFRSFARAPRGELMPEVQTRIVRALETIAAAHPGEAVALFSHGDVIRAAVAYFVGAPLDLFQRIEIRPASVSTLRLSPDGVSVMGVNDTGDLQA
jgi:probable phosphomutase (TIGR03848 family)